MQRFYDCPQIVRDFLVYHETIKGQSPKTIDEYYLDLRMFLRFIKLMRSELPVQTRLDDIPIKEIDPVSFLIRPSCRYRGFANTTAASYQTNLELIDFLPY